MKTRDLLKAARDQGWRVKEISDGWQLLSPDSEVDPIVLHRNSVEGHARSHQNLLAQLRRAGFVLPGEEGQSRATTRITENDMSDNDNGGEAPDPLAALQNEVQIQETVEITRTRSAKIWPQTLRRLLEEYLREKLGIHDDAVIEIRLQVQGLQHMVGIDCLDHMEVRTITIETQAQGGSQST